MGTTTRSTDADVVGASCGAIGSIAIGPVFYPALEAIGSGGDGVTPLSTDLILGFMLGVFMSPLAAFVGNSAGRRLGDRAPTVAESLVLVGIGFLVATALQLGLGAGQAVSGLTDKENLGALAIGSAMGAGTAVIAICLYVVAQRIGVVAAPAPGLPPTHEPAASAPTMASPAAVQSLD